MWNITVVIKIRTTGTLREVWLPPQPFYPVSFHPVFIPGFLSPTSHPHLRQPFFLVSGLSYFFLQKWPDPHRFSYIPFLLIFPNTRMLVSRALLHLTGTLPWRTLEELWNLIWRTKGENIYSLTSVPFWSRVALQALTLLHFGVQQVSTGVCRCPIQDIKEAPGQEPGVCGVDLCRGIGRLPLHKADQSFWSWTEWDKRIGVVRKMSYRAEETNWAFRT